MNDDKNLAAKKIRDDMPVELESQFVLRLPSTPAAALRAAVRSGVMNLKDRLTIQLEPDMRHGMVRFDKWILPSKVVDLPSIIECHKTLDRKTFYKTADICQMMICKEEEEAQEPENESPKKSDKRDRKYLWPHGITPPLKNARKNRFRKTLRKKNVDFPEIEKEVKRLLQADNEAVSVCYKIVNADEKNENKVENSEYSNGTVLLNNPPATGDENSQSCSVTEHDIFGEVLSCSEDEENENKI